MPEFDFPYVRTYPDGSKEYKIVRVEADTFDEALEQAVKELNEADPGD